MCTWTQSENRKGEYFFASCLNKGPMDRNAVNIYKVCKKFGITFLDVKTCPYCGAKVKLVLQKK